MCVWLERYRIQQCCCGCTLRTGSLIIGILEIIGAIINLISGAVTGGPEMGGQIATAVIEIIINAALLYGIYKDNTFFLLPWLVIRGIFCVLLALSPIVVLIACLVVGAYLGLIAIPILIIVLVLAVYFWLCVWSFYLELKEGGRPTPA